MEKKLDLIIEMIKEQGVSLNSKIEGLREDMNEKYDSLKKEMSENYNSLTENYNSLTESYNSLTVNFQSLSEKVEFIEEKLDNLSNQVTILEDYAHDKCEAALDGWVSHLEKQEELGSNVTNLNSKTENHEIRITVLEDVLEA